MHFPSSTTFHSCKLGRPKITQLVYRCFLHESCMLNTCNRRCGIRDAVLRCCAASYRHINLHVWTNDGDGAAIGNAARRQSWQSRSTGRHEVLRAPAILVRVILVVNGGRVAAECHVDRCRVIRYSISLHAFTSKRPTHVKKRYSFLVLLNGGDAPKLRKLSWVWRTSHWPCMRPRLCGFPSTGLRTWRREMITPCGCMYCDG